MTKVIHDNFKESQSDASDSSTKMRQSFFDHLDELRGRIFKSLLAIIICAVGFYAYIDPILAILTKPVGQLIFTSPADAFLAQIILSLFGGFILSLPIVIYQIWRFIASGLKANEVKYVAIFAPVSIGLFILGAFFAYFIMIPIAIRITM